MKKQLFLILAIFIMVSCQDDSNLFQTELQNAEMDSRAIYDNGYVEWDNVTGLSYKLNSDEIKTLSLPWEAGNGHNSGIPPSWYDYNLRDTNPINRYYSQANGWRLVYSNLLDKTQSNKYFALYNRYTGVMRMFFYAIESYSGDGTTSTFVGFHVKGSSSLLNFAFNPPLAMDKVQTDASTFFSPLWSVSNGNASNQVGYHSNCWYGIEVECAYESKTQTANTIVSNIWGTNLALTTTTGTSSGNVEGSVQTTYSNNPTFTLNFTSNSTQSTSVSSTLNVSYNDAEVELGNKIETEVENNNSFFKDLWDGLKSDLPELASKGIKEGISSIFSAGGSFATKAIGKLAQNILGISSGPSTSTSKVDLGIKLTTTSESNTTIQKDMWGAQGIPLPGGTITNELFSEKLGAWNIQQTPKVFIDMYAYSYFWPWDLVPNQTKPRAYEIEFKYYFSPSTLVVNPSLLQEFDIRNLKQDLVFTGNMLSNIKNSTKAYGLYGNTPIYQSNESYIWVKGPSLDFVDNNYNPNTSYSSCWSYANAHFNSKYVLCRVSFDLVSKTDGKTISYSKYFVAESVSRNYYHEEKIIEKDTNLDITSLLSSEELANISSTHEKY